MEEVDCSPYVAIPLCVRLNGLIVWKGWNDGDTETEEGVFGLDKVCVAPVL